MRHKTSLFVGLVLSVLGAMSTDSAAGSSINLPNASFENYNLTDNGTSDDLSASGWLQSPPSNAWIGAWNPLGSDFTGATLGGTPQGGDGKNVAAIDVSGPAGTVASMWASPVAGEKLLAGSYRLTVAVGQNFPGASLPAANYALSLGTSAGILKSEDFLGSDLSVGSLADHFATLNVANNNPHLGEDLVVTLSATNLTGSSNWVLVDNVRLDFTPVPEPSLLAMLTSGVIGLLCYSWRKRG